ncbi:substrate-binding domain-containing protein [Pseudenhygromyxa sp. WMMC2535]|uniref:substrate-binding domain-containing protein n=1 Tax=Pseudenhygromyxa sp. WMMC2535 TaxID=2712867 RepID=UPI001552834B|nr:substrate-binding domain-containing protein [Pseudenhygromyxa sp. WMMC2535]
MAEPIASQAAKVLGWSLAVSGAVLLLIGGWLLVRWVEHGPTPPYLNSITYLDAFPELDPEARPAPKPANLLRLAGSGSNLPLTRALAEAFVRTRPWLRVRVHEGIGSSGGVEAMDDRVIEIGLSSRPLTAEEGALGLREIPYARVAVVIAANSSVPVRGLTSAALVDIYARRRTHWDDGSPVVVLQREPGDSSHLAAAAAIPGFAEADAEAAEGQYWRVLYNERAMQDALVSTFGSIGLFDRGLMVLQDLPLLTLELDGQRPSEAALSSGAYPLRKDLAFVIPDEAAGAEVDPLAIEFISFVFSDRGRAIIRESGYVPLEPPPRSTFAQLRAVGPPPEQAEQGDQGESAGTESGDDATTDTDTDTDDAFVIEAGEEAIPVPAPTPEPSSEPSNEKGAREP